MFGRRFTKGGSVIDNYFAYHVHTDLSTGVTNIDSITKYTQYIARAKECGMTALAFSEHGSVFEWYHKKTAVEAAGMKYVHAIEAYLTTDLTEKVRDNYHCVLIARNYAGVLELNRLVSQSFNRQDNHFYYVPRISFPELFATSDNILVTTACVGGVLGKGEPEVQNCFLNFLKVNKDRCFLEIGHHLDDKQVAYNKKLFELSEASGLRLIAGTDTHSLNEEHERGRSILQKSKNIFFDDEAKWDLKFKTYNELVAAYREQGALPPEVFMQAIENTNVLADMIEEFEIDKSPKYPHIYDNPEEVFREKVQNAISSHPYALQRHGAEKLQAVVDEEFEVYKKTGAIDFMLLQTYLREWERDNGIQCGYGRGSVSGSEIAYLLGVTQMDSIRFGLNFFRFLNPSRVTNADIDTDYSDEDRTKVKQFLLRDKMNLPRIQSAEIITFNTIDLKGAIRDVCRGLYQSTNPQGYLSIADKVCQTAEKNEAEARKKYPEVFEYVDIVRGTIVSVGTHPSGVLISDLEIAEIVGLCSTAKSEYPVTMLNMKELDELMMVKLDILGLDNLGVINETCKLAGIERLTPDNVDLDDEAVWKSIRDDPTLVFQWESDSARVFIKRFMSDRTVALTKERNPNFSYLKWLSFGNGLIRPACASFRDSVANGEFYDNGFTELNEFLAPESGRIAMQETIMQFLVKFCGYSNAESDNVRRAIAKKKGTEKLIPEIEERFIKYSVENFGKSTEECESVIKPFLRIILDAADYGFSWNHSDAYSAIGYVCGYLRYYYPLEFLTAAFNVFSDKTEKTADISKYAQKAGIKIVMPKWGVSRSGYFYDKENMTIAKGLGAVKFISESLGEELYALSHSRQYTYFVDLLRDMFEQTSIDTRQLDILIKLDFFSTFGNQRELLRTVDLFEKLKRGNAKQLKKTEIDGTAFEPIVKKYAVGVTKSGGEAKSYTLLDVMAILREMESAVKASGMEDLSDILKIQNFYDLMGYVGYCSGKEEDRRKLYVLKSIELHRKRDSKLFAYNILGKSLGSGKETWYTVFLGKWEKDPVREGDIIYCRDFERDGKYYRLLEYNHIY